MDRRRFLKLSGLFAAAAAVAPTVIVKVLSEIPAAVKAIELENAYTRLGRTLMALGQYGFLTPDDETEEQLRKMLDLPPRSYDYQDGGLWQIIDETNNELAWRRLTA
jgi:hypothetical protein